jgi:hypothetical protein
VDSVSQQVPFNGGNAFG